MDNVQLWSLNFRKHLAEKDPELFNLFDSRMVYTPDIEDKITVGFWPLDEEFAKPERNDAMQNAINEYLLSNPI